jgi:hypothetical protein
VVELGGLARTEAAGYGEEFDRIAAELLPPEQAALPVPPVPITGALKRGEEGRVSDADQSGAGVL